ncbi:hypothetical protein V6N12_058993 [Hibiscus sabdariffa]|uniref:Uncharacterized protein n=1 Tax=Hibiscus sabdariffa TaxID=183260 RepID=A0ABR2EU78_9ROSI
MLRTIGFWGKLPVERNFRCFVERVKKRLKAEKGGDGVAFALVWFLVLQPSRGRGVIKWLELLKTDTCTYWWGPRKVVTWRSLGTCDVA